MMAVMIEIFMSKEKFALHFLLEMSKQLQNMVFGQMSNFAVVSAQTNAHRDFLLKIFP